MAEPVMTEIEIDAVLERLGGWSRQENRLTRSFQFADFKSAFAFMTESATLAEDMSHHPEWRNVYGRVDVELTTHDAGGITMLDLSLAENMNRIASKHGEEA